MALNLRTFIEVDDVLEKAKLEASDFLPLTQSLTFSENVCDNELLLMEIDEKLLERLNQKKSLTIRGEKADEAVLCTENQTFEVKTAEISNALLVIPNLKLPDGIDKDSDRSIEFPQVLGAHHEYFELKLCKPRLKRIRQLLEMNLYCGELYENEDGEKFTLESLLNVIQASENEIVEELVNMNACYIKGYWRLLDHEYHFRVVSHIMEYIDANFSAIEEFPKNSILDALEDLEPRSVLDQVLSWYADRMDSDDTNRDSPMYCLNQRKVCRFYAEVLLRPADKFVFNEFMEAWKLSVPDGLTTDIKFLQDMALTDSTSTPPVIWLFPIYELPEGMDERFNFLFKTREKWTYDEITPFIQNLTTDKLSVNAMLTKFSRTSTINGTKFYNSKRPIT